MVGGGCWEPSTTRNGGLLEPLRRIERGSGLRPPACHAAPGSVSDSQFARHLTVITANGRRVHVAHD
jgi:hypothetical protein